MTSFPVTCRINAPRTVAVQLPAVGMRVHTVAVGSLSTRLVQVIRIGAVRRSMFLFSDITMSIVVAPFL